MGTGGEPTSFLCLATKEQGGKSPKQIFLSQIIPSRLLSPGKREKRGGNKAERFFIILEDPDCGFCSLYHCETDHSPYPQCAPHEKPKDWQLCPMDQLWAGAWHWHIMCINIDKMRL